MAAATSPLPTLVLNAKNDPFVPGASLPGPAEVSRSVMLEQPDDGGHCGFLVGPFPGTDHVAAARGCCSSSASGC